MKTGRELRKILIVRLRSFQKIIILFLNNYLRWICEYGQQP